MTVSRNPSPNNPYKDRAVDTYIPDNESGGRFFDLHKVRKIADRNGNGDEVFNASNIKGPPQATDHRMGYNKGEDQDVYENTEIEETTQGEVTTAADATETTMQDMPSDAVTFEEAFEHVKSIEAHLEERGVKHAGALAAWIGSKLYEAYDETKEKSYAGKLSPEQMAFVRKAAAKVNKKDHKKDFYGGHGKVELQNYSEEEHLDETLGPDATAKDYIDDFIHSKNKKFDGESKKERIRRALGAFYNRNKE